MDNLWILFAAAGVMAAVIVTLSLLGDHYTLNNIKSKTVGDGQRGTVAARYYGYHVSVVDLRNPTRSDGYNLMTLINRYMAMASVMSTVLSRLCQ